jgi:hypothetical protein
VQGFQGIVEDEVLKFSSLQCLRIFGDFFLMINLNIWISNLFVINYDQCVGMIEFFSSILQASYPPRYVPSHLPTYRQPKGVTCKIELKSFLFLIL